MCHGPLGCSTLQDDDDDDDDAGDDEGDDNKGYYIRFYQSL